MEKLKLKQVKILLKSLKGQALDDETKMRSITWSQKELNAIKQGKTLYALD